MSRRPDAAGPPPLAPWHWPGWLGVGLLVLLARLPRAAQRSLGRGLGALLYWLMPGRRRVAAINLERCFPELDRKARARLLRASFRSLGLGAFEFLRAWWGSLGTLQADSRIEGLARLEAARRSGRGVILLSGHFLTLEICGRLLCSQVPLAGMYRPHASAVFEWAVRRGRLRYASAMFTHDELRPAIRHLRAGGVLWYAPDHAYRRGEHVFAPFFGQPVATLTATHQLARLTGAQVLPFFHRRAGDAYAIRIGAPLDQFPGPDPAADSARVNALIEAMIREAPDEYLWIHKRFKRLPPGQTPPY